MENISVTVADCPAYPSFTQRRYQVARSQKQNRIHATLVHSTLTSKQHRLNRICRIWIEMQFYALDSRTV